MKTTNKAPTSVLLAAAACVALAGAANAGPSTPKDVAPAQDLEEFGLSEDHRAAIERLTEMITPLIDSLGAMLDDLPRYEAPEVLPNGDIIIRRRQPGVPTPPELEPGDPSEGTRT